MSNHVIRRALAGALALSALWCASPAPAHAYVQGPKNWLLYESSSRYPRHAGNHKLRITACGGTQKMELRVDVVNGPDIGYGLKSYACGGATRVQYSGYDTYGSHYRGHFTQVQNGFYGTLRDDV
jgi:hypothetical protein